MRLMKKTVVSTGFLGIRNLEPDLGKRSGMLFYIYNFTTL